MCILQADIHSVYPSVNGTLDRCVGLLNHTFTPIAGTSSHTINIMWTSTVPPAAAGTSHWTPNHFVSFIPLIDSSDSVEFVLLDETVEFHVDERDDKHMRSTPVPADSVSVSSDCSDTMPQWYDDSKRNEFLKKKRCREEAGIDGKTTSTYLRSDSRDYTVLDESPKSEDYEQIRAEDSIPDSPSVKRRRISMNKPYAEEEGSFLEFVAPNALPLPDNDFLSVEQCIKLLRSETPSLVCDNVPAGLKQNVYFVVSQAANSNRRDTGAKGRHWDDCGAWQSASCPTSHYLQRSDGSWRQLRLIDGQYCVKIRSGSTYMNVPLDPQPTKNEVVKVSRYYTTLKADKSYRRRVTWAAHPLNADKLSPSLAIVEYSGTFPQRIEHGNARKPTCATYVRTTVASLDQIGKMATKQRPTDVYAAAVAADDIYGVRSRHQTSQKKYNDRRNKKHGQVISTNFSDQVQHIAGLTCHSKYVRGVAHLGGRVPSILLYTDQQIEDIRQFCIEAEDRTVLCMDKTFNLSDLYATVTAYKCMRLVSCRTGAPPIFIGPVMLHGQSDAQQYHFFVSHIAGLMMNSDLARLTIGTDAEPAMLAGIKSALPNSTNVLCTLHLKRNVTEYLRDKVNKYHRLQCCHVMTLIVFFFLSNADI